MIRPFRGTRPAIHPSVFVDPSAQVIGDVTIGADASVWMNAVVRGDVNVIAVGARTNLQDGVIVHVMRDPSHATTVGDDVTVGHGAVLHGCTVGAACLIGMGAILLNGSVIGQGSIVAAGTLVPEGMVVPERSLVMGSPARVRRQTTDAELAMILASAQNYVAYRLDYMDGHDPQRADG